MQRRSTGTTASLPPFHAVATSSSYHNWEHYSSVRNLAGPHSGLPRIIERNVSQAAQQDTKGKGRYSDQEDGDEGFEYVGDGEESLDSTAFKPTECEELILRSVPGHTLSEVRFLLKQHGNLWETVVEVLIAKDAADAEAGDASGASDGKNAAHTSLASSPNGTRMLRSTRNTALQSPTSASSPRRLNAIRAAIPRMGDPASAVPSPILGSYDGDGEGSGAGSSGFASVTPDLRDDLSGSSSHTSGSKKRSASRGPLILDDDRQYLTKRSRSRSGSGSGSGHSSDSAHARYDERSPSGGSGSRTGSLATDEREARSVDGALVAATSEGTHGGAPSQEDDAMSCSMTTIGLPGTETPGSGLASDSASPLPSSLGPASAAGSSSHPTPPLSAATATSSRLPSGVVLPTHTRRGRELSPPLSPTLVASMLGSSGSRGGRGRGKAKSLEGLADSEDGGGQGTGMAASPSSASPEADGTSAGAVGQGLAALSPKERRELELKRKRDRQRERRALARRQKELKDEAAAAAKSARGVKTSLPAGAGAVAAEPEAKGRGKEKEKRGARGASKREERGAKGKGGGGSTASGGGGNVLPPKGFVELKI